MKRSSKEIGELANRLRVHIVRMTQRAKSSHVGGGLSMADILAVLYGGVLRVDPTDPNRPDRDRLILSKGHACAARWPRHPQERSRRRVLNWILGTRPFDCLRDGDGRQKRRGTISSVCDSK
jgi:hypothetical protein